MEIRDLTSSDIEAAAALWQEAGLTRPWNPPALDLQRAIDGCASTVLGAFADGRLFGTVMVGHDGHRGWIYYLAVAQSQRGRGLGRDLMTTAEGWLRGQGAVKVQLMVRSTNESVLGFYDQIGYETEDVQVRSKWLSDPVVAPSPVVSPIVFAHEAGSGTPVVLLHGFGLDHRSLLPLEPTFERTGRWRRIYLDMPGATRSPATVTSSQELADAVLEEIRERVGGQPFAVLGNSYGGMIARYVAHELRSQVLGLATVAGVFIAPHDERTLPPRTVLREESRIVQILGAALEQYREDAVVESTRDARSFLQYALPGLDGADSRALDRVSESYSLDREPEDAHPEPFSQPALHITGRQDDVVGYSDAWNRIEHYPRASFAVLDGAGHNILFEQSELCSALVADWLARVAGGTELLSDQQSRTPQS